MTEEQAKKMFENVPEHIKEFIMLVEGFYDEYANDIVRCFIALDLKDFTSDQLRELFDLVRHHYSRNYKTPPDTKILMEVWQKRNNQLGLKDCGDYFVDRFDNVYDRRMKKIGIFNSNKFLPNMMDKKIKDKVLERGAVPWTPKMLIEYKGKE